MEKNIERKVLELIATDRIYVPVSSMDGKLKRTRTKLAKNIDLGDYANDFVGERVYARVEEQTAFKARGMKEALDLFETEYPRHGQILRGMIEEKREEREVNLYFGINPGCKLTENDYLGVMGDLGFTESTARSLYPELMDVSRKLARKRNEERSILIG